MKPLTLALLLIFGLLYFTSYSQEITKTAQKIKLFLDCSSTYCDMTYIRSEINIVDFTFDRIASDVHVLVTAQTQGNGGRKYQMIFFGQKAFKGQVDTLQYSLRPMATDVEVREKHLNHLKIGLVPYISKTDMLQHLKIEMKRENASDSVVAAEKDKWNYWVFRVGMNGNVSADQNYLNTEFFGNLSASRTTEKLRADFYSSMGKERSEYNYLNEDGDEERLIVINTSYRLNHTLAKALSDHWSYGYYFFLRNSTFSNYRNSTRVIPAVEYNIYPYKEVNNKFLTFSYGLELTYNNYYEVTIYDKTSETLFGHTARVVANYNQKWGTISGSVNYSNYFHDWSLLNLGIDARAEIRITGNLSMYVFAFGGLTRNQVFIPSDEASAEDVLSRRRQLASGYNFGTWFGINYRFGSMLNNFVNPRFREDF